MECRLHRSGADSDEIPRRRRTGLVGDNQTDLRKTSRLERAKKCRFEISEESESKNLSFRSRISDACDAAKRPPNSLGRRLNHVGTPRIRTSQGGFRSSARRAEPRGSRRARGSVPPTASRRRAARRRARRTGSSRLRSPPRRTLAPSAQPRDSRLVRRSRFRQGNRRSRRARGAS